MKYLMRFSLYIALAFVLFLASCEESPKKFTGTYTYREPQYNKLSLTIVSDTLHFTLTGDTYNQILSFNYFEDNGQPFISFYERRSESVNIYSFYTQQLVKRVLLKDLIPDSPLYKTSVYARNFDSLFVTNYKSLYLIDRNNHIHSKIDYFDRADAMPFYENANPLVIIGHDIYMGVRPRVDDNSFNAIRQWKLVYKLNMEKQSKELHYYLPEMYHQNFYGDNFMKYSFCFNHKGRFVFSFPADSNIYETDLKDFHVAYYAKSKFQDGPILAVGKKALKNDEGFKEYILRDSYGPIYFDPFAKRYIRVAKQKISEEAFNKISWQRKQSLMIFNEEFQIIGEFELSKDVAYNSLLFTSNGNIFARIKPTDEYAIHFIKLSYSNMNKVAEFITPK
jgi:hypothetical protein